MSLWRYDKNGTPSDPIETAALEALLRDGTLKPDALVWREGLPNWVTAGSQPELAGAIKPADPFPPLPSATTPPPPGPASLSFGSTQPLSGNTASDQEDIEKNKVFAVLAYIGLLFLVPLLAAPQSKFARYHTNQGVILFIANIITSVAAMVLMFIPFVGCFGAVAVFAAAIGWLVLMIIGVVNAASGQYKPLPLIGHYQLMK
jgi:uncharacterized membrane protein